MKDTRAGAETEIQQESMHEKGPWEMMTLSEIGDVGELLQGGGGKLSTAGGDTGDTRKPKGSG